MENKVKKTGILAIILSVLLVVGVMAGCNSSQPTLEQNRTVGSLLLSVNPEIKLSYDTDGQLMTIEGKNTEGQQIVDQMSDFSGEPVKEIVNELVMLIYNAGYLVEEIDGNRKNIIIEIESGSQLPSEDFLEQIVINVERMLTMRNANSEIQIMNSSDYGISDYSDYSDALETSNVSDYGDQADNSDDYEDSDYEDSDYDDSDYDDSDYDDSDYDDSDYDDSDYDDSDYDDSDYDDSDYDDSDYDDSDYDDSDYDDSDYDDSDYDDSDYDDSDYDDSDYDDSDYDDSDYDDSDYDS